MKKATKNKLKKFLKNVIYVSSVFIVIILLMIIPAVIAFTITKKNYLTYTFMNIYGPILIFIMFPVMLITGMVNFNPHYHYSKKDIDSMKSLILYNKITPTYISLEVALLALLFSTYDQTNNTTVNWILTGVILLAMAWLLGRCSNYEEAVLYDKFNHKKEDTKKDCCKKIQSIKDKQIQYLLNRINNYNKHGSIYRSHHYV